MRSCTIIVVGMFAAGGVARAQSAGSAPGNGYVEGVAQSAFGNVTSQSFAGEIGVTVHSGLQVSVDLGKVRDAATADLSASAQKIAGLLTETQSGTSYHVKQPVAFGTAGIKYVIPGGGGRIEPYVLAGSGVARTSRNVKITVAGADVTSTLPQYGVTHIGNGPVGHRNQWDVHRGWWPGRAPLALAGRRSPVSVRPDFRLRSGVRCQPRRPRRGRASLVGQPL